VTLERSGRYLLLRATNRPWARGRDPTQGGDELMPRLRQARPTTAQVTREKMGQIPQPGVFAGGCHPFELGKRELRIASELEGTPQAQPGLGHPGIPREEVAAEAFRRAQIVAADLVHKSPARFVDLRQRERNRYVVGKTTVAAPERGEGVGVPAPLQVQAERVVPGVEEGALLGGERVELGEPEGRALLGAGAGRIAAPVEQEAGLGVQHDRDGELHQKHLDLDDRLRAGGAGLLDRIDHRREGVRLPGGDRGDRADVVAVLVFVDELPRMRSRRPVGRFVDPRHRRRRFLMR
jgi:hypothetical protein